MTDDDVVSDILVHFGKKGMKWGVRKEAARAGGAPTTKAGTKMDKKWVKGTLNQKQMIKAYNHMAGELNTKEISRINNDPRFKGKDLSKTGPLQKKYHDEYSKTATNILNKYAKENFGTSPSGEMKVRFEYDIDKHTFPDMFIINRDHPKFAQHAAMDDGVMAKINVVWDAMGFIRHISLPNLNQSSYEDVGENFLEHYGKKGMKWGVRRKRPSTTTYTKPANKLTDQELSKRIKRLEQEKKYNKLNQKEMSKGKKAADEILTNSGKKAASTALAAASVALGVAAVKIYLVAKKVSTH